MKFFILDDDMNVIHILNKIIKDRNLGVVIGEETDGKSGFERIKASKPDIALIDLLMPGIDGLNIIKELKKEHMNTEFIMISQVTSKKMIEKAYRYGVEYYICKPINAIEVEAIIKKVMERIQITKTLSQVQQIFNKVPVSNPVEIDKTCDKYVNKVLRDLGIIGEKGSQDIVAIIDYVVKNGINLNSITIHEICSRFTDNPKSMEQRIRRAINRAMSNIANIGLEDYMNEVFAEYSNYLFNFEQVRLEMEYLRGNSSKGGSTNIKKFLMGLISYCQILNN